jgi:hypothetical protein
MKSEGDPITDDEWLIRRVPRNYYDESLDQKISPNAFEPRVKGRDPDTDGISLYRADCLSDPSDVLATVKEERRGDIALVRVSVSLLKKMGYSIRAKPDERVKGHVVIPELNSIDYGASKAKFTPAKVSLAEEASKDENILKKPTPNPPPLDPS